MGNYKTGIVIPIKVLQKNLKFTRAQHITVIASMLLRINKPLVNANNVFVKVRGLGVVKTHGNRKNCYQRNMSKYNKTAWKKKQEAKEFTEEKLLF